MTRRPDVAADLTAETCAIVEAWLAELPAAQAAALRARVLDERRAGGRPRAAPPAPPVDTTARLLPLRVADPEGRPPWGMRTVTASRGLVCLQVGRVVGEQLGVLGQDGIAGDDGRLHPLPLATAGSSPTPCVLPDGKGQLFRSSGDRRDRACYGPGELKDGRRHCPPGHERQLAYGLLGPQAAAATFTANTKQLVETPFGTSCPPVDPKRPFCPLKGYVASTAPSASAGIRCCSCPATATSLRAGASASPGASRHSVTAA